MIFLNRFNMLISKINFKKIKNILTKLRYKFMLLIKKTKKTCTIFSRIIEATLINDEERIKQRNIYKNIIRFLLFFKLFFIF
jgi:hypothetical protein